MRARLRVHQGGSGEPLLVLLHGLGATGDVWGSWRPAGCAGEGEAAARSRRISGLAGLLPASDPVVDAGLREQDGRWRLAMDPAAFAVGAPDMAQLVAQSQAPVTLVRGEHDPMNTDQQLARLGVPTITLPALGHNSHVQDPELSIALPAP